MPSTPPASDANKVTRNAKASAQLWKEACSRK